jgi:DNA (cytosine-5)-methyltransferase 1
MNFYNEIDDFACGWLDNLMVDGMIPKGKIDNRPIQELKADDVKGYTQCHFFAGIGGWPYALQLAGWPTDRPVWTGSCPCQPFSSAGKQKGKTDERHLWPVWFNLIRECRPTVCFGEQVASAIAHGWLDDVYTGLEAEGYAVGSTVLPACSVGAPHKRDRLWFVGQSNITRPQQGQQTAAFVGYGGAAFATGCNVANTISEGLQGHDRNVENGNESRRFNSKTDGSAWQDGVWVDCPDGKQRLIEPSIPLLAHGIPQRVGRLRGYGNAIVPQVAAAFIGAFIAAEEGDHIENNLDMVGGA